MRTSTVCRLKYWLCAPGFLFLLFNGVGCSGTIHPPAVQSDSTTVYLADYGRHSSILLPEQNGNYVEWAYGDWKWFALGETRWYNAIGAILWSGQSTLGRREVAAPADDASLAKSLEADRVVKVQVPEKSAARLLASLEKRYESEKPPEVYSNYSKLEHVKDHEQYWVLHNCNHVTMRWLKELGCRVDGFGMLSNFKVAK